MWESHILVPLESKGYAGRVPSPLKERKVMSACEVCSQVAEGWSCCFGHHQIRGLVWALERKQASEFWAYTVSPLPAMPTGDLHATGQLCASELIPAIPATLIPGTDKKNPVRVPRSGPVTSKTWARSKKSSH